MSHFNVLVVCPPDTDRDNYNERVTELMAPYDEDRDVAWRIDEDDEDDGGHWHNPDGHWDYWTVGGRWRGYFPVADGLTDDDLKQVVATDTRINPFNGEPADGIKREGCVDAGPKRCLGLDKLRDRRGREAVQEWDRYAMAVDGTEQHAYWSDFLARAHAAEEQAALTLGTNRRGLVEKARREACEQLGMQHRDDGWPRCTHESEYEQWKAVESDIRKRYEAQWDAAVTYNIDQARKDYHRQERVRRCQQTDEFGRRRWEPIDDLDRYTRDEYEQRARNTAVPTFAVVLADGTWCAPGRMGWFGMSTDGDDDRQGFAERMNPYLDELPDDTFLAVVDCHV